jgi:hypothetical protein
VHTCQHDDQMHADQDLRQESALESRCGNYRSNAPIGDHAWPTMYAYNLYGVLQNPVWCSQSDLLTFIYMYVHVHLLALSSTDQPVNIVTHDTELLPGCCTLLTCLVFIVAAAASGTSTTSLSPFVDPTNIAYYNGKTCK